MDPTYRRFGFAAAALALAAYGSVALMGPQGFFSLRDKYREIRRLERENAELERSNKEMAGRIEKVRNSKSQREIIVKDKLKYRHADEVRFVLPDSHRTAETPDSH